MTGEKKTTKKKATKASPNTKKAEPKPKANKAESPEKPPTKKATVKKTASTKKAGPKKSATVKKTAEKKPTIAKKSAGKSSQSSEITKKENQNVEQTQLQPDNRSSNIEVLEPSNELNTNQSLVRGKFPPYNMKPEEEYMNAQQLVHFRLILNDWKAELMEEVDRTVHHMKDDSANLPDPADRATQEEEFNLELRTRDRERKLIKKIDKTLERIEHDDYGFCDSCGIEVGLRRLEARPTANLCIDCKTLDEIKERQFRG